MSLNLPSGTVTFLFTDIEGSRQTSLEDAMAYALKELQAGHRETK